MKHQSYLHFIGNNQFRALAVSSPGNICLLALLEYISGTFTICVYRDFGSSTKQEKRGNCSKILELSLQRRRVQLASAYKFD